MLTLILFLLLLVWIFGYGPVDMYRQPVFVMNKTEITIWNIFVLLLGVWLIAMLPTPFSTIGIILFLLWLFPAFGFLVIDFAASFFLILIILSLLFYVLSGFPH